MRFLMKIPLPTVSENAVAGDPQFDQKLRGLFAAMGARATYSNMADGRRIEYVLVDIEVDRLTATAEPIVRFLGVKPEFLPEVTPQPYYGRVGY